MSMIGLAFNILFRKNGKFPAYEVGHNKDMKKMGITCVKHDEYKCFGKADKNACSSCESLFGEDT